MDEWDGYAGEYTSSQEAAAQHDQKEMLRSARKQFSRIGGCYVIGAIIIYIVQLVPTLLLWRLKPEWQNNANINMMVSVLPMYLIGMPILIFMVKKLPGDTIERRRMGAGKFIVAAIMSFALMYVFNVVGNIFSFLVSLLKGHMVNNAVMDMTSSVSMWLIFFYMVLCAPIMEEYIFRKLIVERTARYGQGVAVVLSGFMFGLFHGNWNQFIYAFALGCFLAYLYVRTGNLKITIGIHMMINFMGGFVSTGLFRMLDLDMDEYMDAAFSGQGGAMMEYFSGHLAGWMLFFAFFIFVIGVSIAGTVLFIVALATKKFTLVKSAEMLPKGKRFSTVILNVGMMIYCVFWFAMIIWQLFF